ncbi:MAG: sulfur oxidation c-type cytochrome SoxX [Rubrivivax sp.]
MHADHLEQDQRRRRGTPRVAALAAVALAVVAALGCAGMLGRRAGQGSRRGDAHLVPRSGHRLSTAAARTPTSIACSVDKPLAEAAAERLMADAKATVKWPADGRYIGDWREGEKIAQNGRGFTWTERAATGSGGGMPSTGHQIGKAEISTIGPSLYNYGKNRGVADVTSATAAPVVQYTWTKIWNSRSFSACSTMPRFGHAGLG